MNKKFLIVIPILIILASAGCAKAVKSTNTMENQYSISGLTMKQKQEDAKYLMDNIVSRYPFFEVKKNLIGYDFLAHKNELLKELEKSKDNDEFYKNINKTLMLLQNGHAYVITNAPYKFYYADFKCKYIEGNYVVAASKIRGINPGEVLLAVDNKPIDDYVKDYPDTYQLGYDFKRKKIYCYDYIFTLKNLDKKMTYQVTLQDQEKHLKKVNLTLKEFIPSNNKSQQMEDDNQIIVKKIIKPNKIAYLKINTFAIYGDKQKEYYDILDKFFKEIKGCKGLILDIRDNGGGDQIVAENLISYLIDKKISVQNYYCFKNSSNFPNPTANGWTTLTPQQIEENPKLPNSVKSREYTINKGYIKVLPNENSFTGKVYTLVNSNVFSAAEIFANTVKRVGISKLVGTHTGGDGIQIQPASITLPNSKLTIRMPICLGLDSEGRIDEEVKTAPDYYSEQSLKDYLAGQKKGIKDTTLTKYDTVLNDCIRIINKNL